MFVLKTSIEGSLKIKWTELRTELQKEMKCAVCFPQSAATNFLQSTVHSESVGLISHKRNTKHAAGKQRATVAPAFANSYTQHVQINVHMHVRRACVRYAAAAGQNEESG